ncbi:MAG: thioredoxin-like domain-containing protein [Gemmataceae bacterium]|nr:thioredoxin-like domain-containing protein [Gemmataceae bacterium]
MKHAVGACIWLAVAVSWLPAQPQSPLNSTPSLKTIRYDALAQRVAALEGRVVLVDFWANYCLPCKREFPRLMQLHRQYARQGLVVLTVSLDDPDDSEAGSRLREFLSAQRADTENYWLQEKPEVWQAKLKIDGPPCVFLFDRRGRLVKKYHDHVDYEDIGRRIEVLLR